MSSAVLKSIQTVASVSAVEETGIFNVSKALTKLLSNRQRPQSVFFATLVLRLTFVVDWSCDTGATDGKAIYFNPEFVNGLTSDQRVGFLVHEIMHCTNKHFARLAGRDLRLWNIATDIAINQIIVAAGYVLPDGCLLPGQFGFPADLSGEQYYGLLMQEQQKKKSESGDDEQEQDESGNSSGGKADDGSDQDGENGSASGDQDDPGKCGGVRAPKAGDGQNLTDSQVKELEAKWDTRTVASEQMAEKIGRGDLPGSLKKMVENIKNPTVNWREALHEFVTRSAKNDSNWNRPNRRHIGRGFYLPSLKSLEIGHLVVALDSSGSVWEFLNQFVGEVTEIANIGTLALTILIHDTGVQKVIEWNKDDGELSFTRQEIPGGGGTDHCCVFDWIDENCEEPPVGLICLTDCYTTFPDEMPIYPVLWAATTTEEQATIPFGERVLVTAY